MPAPSRARIKRACERLASIDPALAAAYAAIGVPAWRSGEASYALIARMITGQQVSTRAAATIWARVEAGLGPVTPASVLSTDRELLRSFGLSAPKVSHFVSIAEAMETGSLDLDRVQSADLDAGRAELMAVRGIGPWTADLFLLYATGAMDAFPAGDVALIEAHSRLSGYAPRLESKAFTSLAERWRPHRGVAAHLLWGWVNAQRGRDAVIDS